MFKKTYLTFLLIPNLFSMELTEKENNHKKFPFSNFPEELKLNVIEKVISDIEINPKLSIDTNLKEILPSQINRILFLGNYSELVKKLTYKQIGVLIKKFYSIDDINKTFLWEPTPFSSSSKRIDKMQILLYAGANINAKDENGISVLERACFAKKRKAVEFLIKSGAFTPSINSHEHPIHAITSIRDKYQTKKENNKRKVIAQLFINRTNLNAPLEENEFGILNDVISLEDLTILELLIESGININADKFGHLPLNGLTMKLNPKAWKMLKEYGALEFIYEERPEKFSLLKLPQNLQAKILDRVNSWQFDANRAGESLLESFQQFENHHDWAIKLNNKSIVDLTRHSYKNFLTNVLKTNNLNDEDFKKLNQYILDSLKKEQLANSLILLIKVLIQLNKFDATITDQNNTSILSLAIYKKQFPLAKLLIEVGSNVKATDNYRNTPLMCASYSGNIDIVKLLIERGADINAVADGGLNALTIAIYHNHIDIASLLARLGAKINVNTKEANIAEYLFKTAADKNKDFEGCNSKVKILLECGADVNATNSNGETALMIACLNGYTSIAKLLIEGGAEVDSTSKNGNTALIWATIKNNVHLAEMLIKSGANVNVVNNENKTAFLLAQNKDIIELLINAGADIDKDNKGKIKFISATLNGHFNIVELLLKAGMDANTEYDGDTALSLAVNYGHTAITSLLIKAGADLNKADKFGETPLMSALYHGHLHIATLLIDAGKKDLSWDLNLKNKEGKTASDIALDKGYREIFVNLELTKIKKQQDQPVTGYRSCEVM